MMEPNEVPQPADRSAEIERARAILLRTLSRAPRSRHELRERLVQRDIDEGIADELLDRFEEVGLIDDAQYAQMLVRTRHAERGQARRAIAHELRRKGLSDQDSREALEQIDADDEFARAQELISRRIDSVRGLPRDRAIQRLVGYLGRRGYSPAVALSVIRPALDADESGMI